MNKKNEYPLYSVDTTASGALTLERLIEAAEQIQNPIKFKREKRKKDFYKQLFAELEFEEKKND